MKIGIKSVNVNLDKIYRKRVKTPVTMTDDGYMYEDKKMIIFIKIAS